MFEKVVKAGAFTDKQEHGKAPEKIHGCDPSADSPG
jgi:hypothetical protein